MAQRSKLGDSALAGFSAEDAAITPSPARGKEMRNFLQTKLLQRNRSPVLVHSWEFWHDRQDRAKDDSPGQGDTPYEDRLVSLAAISDVKAFWNVFNNFDISQMPLRDSVHLFHKGVKPVWEDPRNVLGGSWTFRVAKQSAPDFWKEVCMMAIGENLQQAIYTDRTTFVDDICGVSLSVRFNSYLVQIWNRDSNHEKGIEGILDTVKANLSENLASLKDGSYYYKKHSEHAGFAGREEIVGPRKSPPGMRSTSDKSPEGIVNEQQDTFTDTQQSHRAEARQVADDMAYANAKMKQSMDTLAKEHGLDDEPTKN